jgi:YidC/Oxa1 family membrane protein insertase
MRRLLTAQVTGTEAELNRAYDWGTLQKATVDPTTGSLKLLSDDRGPLAWTALGNKYFAAFTRPVAAPGTSRHLIGAASGLVIAPHALAPAGSLIDHGDLVVRLVSQPMTLSPGESTAYAFEIYAGPKDADSVRAADPAYAGKQVYFQLAQSADQRCMCTFLWLEELMVWLLEKIHLVVRNYGIAIIVLVIIIRSLLHPLTVWQQKSMFRMQDSMGRIQPKIEAIREKYANDKVKQNQEMMRLWADEGVNPLASMVAFIPLFLQMPILVALWTALNTDVHLRHAPFDGWWIRDLSAPDSLIRFSEPITIPILGWLPLIGGAFSNIASINLLPILMGVSMWLQQKYMPKPDHLKERLEAAKHQPRDPNKPRSGMSPEDQLRQQQIMAYMMSILFPLMFYKMPAGLNLYWMATNVFGICESLIIRKQLREEKKRRESSAAPPPKKPRRPGPLGRLFKHLAEQAEQVQRRADELAKADPGRREGKKKN